jgi:hypothetical protein
MPGRDKTVLGWYTSDNNRYALKLGDLPRYRYFALLGGTMPFIRR